MKKLQTLEELNESLDSVNKEDCLVGDATGYLIPSDDVLSKLTKDEILKMMNKMSDKQYDAQVGNKEKELDELVSATKYLEKYLEVYHNMKIHEVLEGRSKINMDEDASDVYDKFSKKFPNASDLIAYYIFNYKESDNNLLKYIDEYGSDLSSLAMEYENNWEDNMEDIESRLKELLDISEAKTINKDVLNTINMLNFQSDWDDPNEFDFKVDGNQLEAISKEIAADISRDLTANNIEHELNGVYITLTGIVSESYSISAGKGEISSKEQAIALIPAQKEVDGEKVDFQDGESITVSDGENSYKFIWIGGSPKEAPEESVKEALNLDSNMKRIILQALKYFKSGSSSDSNAGKKHASENEIDFVIKQVSDASENKTMKISKKLPLL